MAVRHGLPGGLRSFAGRAAEKALAKAELRESAVTAVKGVTKLGASLALALAGSIALTAFLVLGLGDLLGGRYWLAALIVGAVELALGVVSARSAMKSMSEAVHKPAEAVESLREDKEWVGREVKELRREITTAGEPARSGR
jgi:hypothetical protein